MNHFRGEDQQQCRRRAMATSKVVALKGLASYEFICKNWTVETERFAFKPLQHYTVTK